MITKSQIHKLINLFVAVIMSSYFIGQVSIQNYLIELKTEIVSSESDYESDTQGEDSNEESKEEYKKFHIPEVYDVLLYSLKENFTYYTESAETQLSVDILNPPPERC